MLTPLAIFSGFSVKDLEVAKKFYADTLGLQVDSDDMGLHLKLPVGGSIYVYQKADHMPASYTMLNLEVPNIDEAVDELASKGVQFEHYDDMPAPQDEKGILRGLAAQHGPDIAWFTDPSGNIISVLQDK